MMQPSNLFFPDSTFVRRMMQCHFDPQAGTPYWLQRDQALEGRALERVQTFEDFKRLVGFRNMEEQQRFERDTRFLPLETFISRRALEKESFIWASQTGGTTGAPKHGTWGSSYWEAVLQFSDEMLDAHGVPRGVNWLFIGPTGPHTTGRLVISMAERRGGRCFSIDLDPRIVKIFGTEGNWPAYERYVRHIWEQVAPIIKHQNIGVLFATSKLLEMIPEKVGLEPFKKLQAIVHAGTTMTRDTHQMLREECFPGIPIVGIYGTSTTSVSYQKPPDPEDDGRVVYIPSSPYVVMECVDEKGQLVEYGREGRVATYRFTEDSLIPGFWERDMAVRVKPFGRHAAKYGWDWIEDPYSPEFTVEGKVEGVY
ncbi:AMP-dependent synthetase [Corallococcus exercitus]|uniref:AMP-dependent synthetase n=1 Tax=Corallococcus exercitus TaxID=2316736 RepID=A0A7Y4NT77_9BACT|nr:AMP-dependent synthetase [Corallococcus exercitus]NOK35481.1 AMP-dependent synthetase [Corallococcus exercitus]